MSRLHLLPRLLLGACLGLCSAAVLAAPPSDADIEGLLKASRAESMLQAILPQMEAAQRQQFEQLTADKPLSAEQKAEVQEIQARTNQIVREALSWQQMRPLYLEVYKKTFTSEEVRAITRFYQSRAGQSLLDKTPELTQNLMQAMQQKMIPMLEQLQTELQTVAEERAKAAPAKPKKK